MVTKCFQAQAGSRYLLLVWFTVFAKLDLHTVYCGLFLSVQALGLQRSNKNCYYDKFIYAEYCSVSAHVS